MTPPLADDHRRHKSGDSRADVNDKSPREIERTQIMNPSSDSPNPVRDRGVDERRPQDNEHEVRLKPKALRKCAGNKSGSDDSEHHLKNHEQLMGDRRRIVRIRFQPDAAQSSPLQTADNMSDIRPECETVTEKDPLDGNNAESDKALHHCPQDVFSPHHAPVKEGKARSHQHDKSGRNQHPRSIAGVNFLNRY